MNNAPELLYIDDEANNLIGFKATFRYRYVVHTALTTIEAHDILQKNPNIRIIFCDQRMPGESGVDFLNRIKKEFPKPIRILLTAYADMETVVEAVNKGHIFRFVRKPWVEEEIVSSIEEANNFYIANTMLEMRNQELQKAYDELDKFAYSVSHDLRDPLSSVLSAIKMASEFDDIDQVRDVLKLMEGSLVKLDAYIDSLRDYYLLKRGELTLSKIDFRVVFDNIKQFYTMSMRNNQIDFRMTVDQDEKFISDTTVLDLVLHNLLSNAFKYQREGCQDKFVKLSVVVANDLATITVADNGIGIPQDEVDNIFKLFFRASDQAQGMGFGLYNVQNALAKLQGTIQVDSKQGEGTSFQVVIPNKLPSSLT